MATFSEKVVKIALSIPKGKVITYSKIAMIAGGAPILARSITSILGKAEQRGVTGIPYHRIIYSNGKIWVNDHCRASRMKLYKKEGIRVNDNDKIINLKDILL